jgi:MoaA/NifB/PqqE/SkfB family radical SAM enzyme
MKLEDIGFYTLSNERARTACSSTPVTRLEMLVTSKCNLRCPYCRGPAKGFEGELTLEDAQKTLDVFQDLINLRISGGEPTSWEPLYRFIKYARCTRVQGRIAISSNGTAPLSTYQRLIDEGVSDFSISLDGDCCSVAADMAGGVNGVFEKASNTIRFLSKQGAYVTIGIVLTERNVNNTRRIIQHADSLQPSDIRIIPAAQFGAKLNGQLAWLDVKLFQRYPILKYRITNFQKGKSVRGLDKKSPQSCPLVLDDVAVNKGYHFPCIIYMREHGKPIGLISENMRKEREEWYHNHNTHEDPICSRNCLDVCVDYNKCWEEWHKKGNDS